MKKFLCTISLLLSIHSTRAEIDLQKSLQLAYANSPRMKMNELREQNAIKNASNSFWSFFPQLQLNTTHGLQDSYSGNPLTRNPSPTFRNAFNLQIVENLYDSGDNWTRWKISSLQSESASIEGQKEENDFVLEVVSNYLAQTLALQKKIAQEHHLQKVKKQFDMAKGLHQQGLKSLRDFQRFETEMQKHQLEFLRSESHYLEQHQRLLSLLDLTKEEFTPLSSEEMENLIKNLQKIPANTPLLKEKMLQKSDEIGDLEVEYANKEWISSLRIEGSAGYGMNPYYNPDQRPAFNRNGQNLNWSALISINLNLWDWGIKKRESEMSRAKAAINHHQNLIFKRELFLEEEKLKNRRQELQQSYNLAKRLFLLEQKNFQLMDNDYRLGKVSYLDLILGLNNLLQSEMIHLDTLHEYVRVLMEHLALHGNLIQYFHR